MPGDDERGGLFGVPVDALADGGGLVADCRRGVSFPRTMDRGTALRGGLLFLAAVLYLPAPLLVGYVLAAARAAAADAPAPSFANWKRQYLRGLGGIALVGGALFVPAFVAVLLTTAIGGQEPSDPVAALLVLAWAYLTPWTLAVYACDSWRGFLDGAAWQWLVTPAYVATVVLTAAGLAVGYVLVLVTAITVVGWLFVGFLALVAIGAFLGGRYRSYRRGAAGETPAAADAVAGGLRSAVGLVGSAVDARSSEAGGGTPSPDSAGGDGADGDDGDGVRDYTRYRERARRVETTGPLARLESGDDGRVQFRSLEHDDEAAVAAFERAVERWERIDDADAVATVLDTGSEPTPWVAHDPLDAPLRELGGDLSPGAVVAVAAAVDDALTTGRRYSVAHGAVTPDCVFVSRAGGNAPARERIDAAVGDWELRRDLADVVESATLPAHFAAPEQFGEGPTDDAVDVYQLGAVAHYALFGTPPFADAAPETLRDPDRDVTWTVPSGHHVDDATVAALRRALSTDPADRHESTGAFVADLRRALGPGE
ncbi:hypothetical protein [Haloarcula litorea]|uniref:hypothetical protein n=1 Tax=Haloarcula litorea TaxID=3032579 RepID=UPI0023E7A8FF|nr:hypothetical protein [Halomicroarcula sp. GDY20]